MQSVFIFRSLLLTTMNCPRGEAIDEKYRNNGHEENEVEIMLLDDVQKTLDNKLGCPVEDLTNL